MPSRANPEPGELISRVRAVPAARPLLDRLGDAEDVYLVGGAVRDLLLDGQPAELDLLVEGDAGELAARLSDAPRSHERFGTATVTIDGHTYDIASARRETYARPGALPTVEPASLSEDLLRRDFTVNSAAITLGGPHAGELHTAPHALEDLAARRLRVLHPRSFEDDPTRLLRLARYASRLRFEVEPRTSELAELAIAGGAMATVSGARVGTELRLLAREPDPVSALDAVHRLGLDAAIAPGFGLDDPELVDHALRFLPPDGRADLLVLAIASRGVARDVLGELLDALAFEGAERDTILAIAARAKTVASELGAAELPSQIAQALAGAGPELAALVAALGPAAETTKWLERLRHVQLEIDGSDLIAAGVPQGPAIGRGLRAALDAKLDGRVAGREAELAEAVRAADLTR